MLAIKERTSLFNESHEKISKNISEISYLFNLAKGYRNTSQFLRDCKLDNNISGARPIIDIINGKCNPELRSYHIARVAEASERRVDLQHLSELTGLKIDYSTLGLKSIKVVRGTIYNCNFGDTIDNIQGGTRPSLVISIPEANDHSTTLWGIPISTATCKGLPVHVFLHTESGLYKESVALVEQMRVISKSQLLFNGETQPIGQVPEDLIENVESAIMKEMGRIGLYFNENIARDYSIALHGIQEIKQRYYNVGVQMAENIIISKFEEYCKHYNKDMKEIYESNLLKLNQSHIKQNSFNYKQELCFA